MLFGPLIYNVYFCNILTMHVFIFSYDHMDTTHHADMQEHDYAKEFDFSLICEYFSGINRQGPGSDESTLHALSFVDGLTAQSHVADLGCGTGASTLVLARHTPAHITALDLFPGFLEKLRHRAQEMHVADHIDTIAGSMDELPFAEETFDVVWSEGAIYNIGFERGLKLWRRYLKRNGYIAVTEISWLTDKRPTEIAEYWQAAYPGIDTMAHKIDLLQRSGYTPVAAFVLPENCWTTNYYAPMQTVQRIFLERHRGETAAELFVREQQREAELYARYKDCYGYVFYIGRKI